MKPLLAESQRCEILEAMPQSGVMLEWGSGGSTQWLLERFAPEQHLISIEHDDLWAKAVHKECQGYGNWTQIVAPPTRELATTATPDRECPVGLDAFLSPDVSWQDIDVLLIDSVARGCCLIEAAFRVKSGAVVFLHDVGRGWYDWALDLMRIRGLKQEKWLKPNASEYPPIMWSAVLG